MNVVIFLIVLAVLILAHELGHFLVARLFKIKVEEFGIGFPPRAKTLFVKKGTKFTLNWIPLGGFVKLFGETPKDESSYISSDSFVAQKKGVQALVLVAGVFFNLVFAWLLLSLGFFFGLPGSASLAPKGAIVKDPTTVIVEVLADSPAEEAGLLPGDQITSISSGSENIEKPLAEDLEELIINNPQGEVSITYLREGEFKTIKASPEELLPGRQLIGVGLETVGTISLPIHRAFVEGAALTGRLTGAVTVALGTLITDAFQGEADLSTLSGPVGIVGAVGDAAPVGAIALLTLTALISINLAVINLLPIPALDGGRLLFVLIEWIKGSYIRPQVANAINAVGFGLLIILALVVTYHDIIKLF